MAKGKGKGKRKAEDEAAEESGSGDEVPDQKGTGNEEAGKAAKKAAKQPKVEAEEATVNPKRVRTLKEGKQGKGPVIYWMSRDQRLNDNWALLHAFEAAKKTGAKVAVAFNLVDNYLNAGARHFGFMLRGLQAMQPLCARHGLPFYLLKGDPAETLPGLARDLGAGLLVTDYACLRLGRQWRKEVGEALKGIPFHEVDAHNVVPVWEASSKRETGARTIRPKIHKLLPEFLEDFPELPKQTGAELEPAPEPVDWEELIAGVTRNQEVPEVQWCQPGEEAALEALHGKEGFLQKARLGIFDAKRNDPNEYQAVSHLSPYLHFGQLAAQRAALEAAKLRSKFKGAVESFLEELVVRRELSDNFCTYEPNYDNLGACAAWARESLDKHRGDPRDPSYSEEELEQGKTQDELWNACQLEMVHLGKMHGFMRMYWAKKILEWTPSPEDAVRIAIHLNDKYEIDGRDPNGYVGVMWAIGGIHDQGWAERAIFGKIRYMNYAGCKRKFKVEEYQKFVAKRLKEAGIKT